MDILGTLRAQSGYSPLLVKVEGAATGTFLREKKSNKAANPGGLYSMWSMRD